MADSSIAVTPGSGANVDTRTVTGGDHQQVVAIGNGVDSNVATVNANGALLIQGAGSATALSVTTSSSNSGAISCSNYNVATVTITGTYAGINLTFEVSTDGGTTWVPIDGRSWMLLPPRSAALRVLSRPTPLAAGMSRLALSTPSGSARPRTRRVPVRSASPSSPFRTSPFRPPASPSGSTPTWSVGSTSHRSTAWRPRWATASPAPEFSASLSRPTRPVSSPRDPDAVVREQRCDHERNEHEGVGGHRLRDHRGERLGRDPLPEGLQQGVRADRRLDTPVLTFPVASGATLIVPCGELGIRLGTGIAWALLGSAGAADSATTACSAASDTKVSISYL